VSFLTQPFLFVSACKPDSVSRLLRAATSIIYLRCLPLPVPSELDRSGQLQPGYTWHFNPQGLSPARLPCQDVRSYRTFSPLLRPSAKRYIFCDTIRSRLRQDPPFQMVRCPVLSGLSSTITFVRIAIDRQIQCKDRQLILESAH